MKRFNQFCLTCVFLFFGIHFLFAQQKTRVEILGADLLEGEITKLGNTKRLKGNVKLKQDFTYMNCDSAILYDDSNLVKAYSNVKIRHNDSLTIVGQYLKYDGNTKHALIEQAVKMFDKSMTLTTEQLDFDMNSNIGYYTNGGTLLSKQNTLTSQYGYYYSNTKEFFFKKNVLLVNPEYTVRCDTMKYDTRTKVSYFLGSTIIQSNLDKIICENGWYDNQNDISQFSKNAILFTEKKMLRADSLYYDRKNLIGKAFRNIELYDSIQKIRLFGNFGITNGKTKRTLVTQNPYAVKIMDNGDSLFTYADSLFLFQKEKKPKQAQQLRAFRNVKIYKNELQAICDSMVYAQDDSILTLYKNPIMWSDKNQITADTILFFINNNRIDSFRLYSNSFLILQEKGTHFNQVKGKNMNGRFDSSALKYIYVFGNAQSIYYAKEDSINYTGVNVIDCSEMEFYFKNKKMSKAVFITQPDATMYPLDELKPEELRLKGFKWLENMRPSKK